MAKAGISSAQTADMSHAELVAWIGDVLLSLGVQKDEGKIISMRRKPPIDK